MYLVIIFKVDLYIHLSDYKLRLIINKSYMALYGSKWCQNG